MAGFVAADKNGTVLPEETAPSDRWKSVQPTKKVPFTTLPDTNDATVYMDELVNFLVQKYGTATSSTGINAYSLDNEPALWHTTHPRVHPQQVTCNELTQKSVTLARAIKSINTTAAIFGPALYGFSAFTDLQSASDWDALKGFSSWFLDYYLNQMKLASDSSGQRLLDVLDIHWYPEARGNGERIVWATNPTAQANALARMQAPRTLWDSTYIEESWIGEWGTAHLPLIPKLKESIHSWYPHTRFAITEFNYGGENHISGGIAMADVLGIMADQEVFFASYWPLEDQTNYTTAAYQLYRNYDGHGATYGTLKVNSTTSNTTHSSVHAALDADSSLHLILLNKNYTDTLKSTITLTGNHTYVHSATWYFNAAHASLSKQTPPPTSPGTVFSYAIPPLTASHLIFTVAPTHQTHLTIDTAPGYRLNIQGSSLSVHAPEHQQLTLQISDCAGHQKTLVHTATGEQQINLSALNIPSDIYILTLTTQTTRHHLPLLYTQPTATIFINQ